jgi:hypothetical protein
MPRVNGFAKFMGASSMDSVSIPFPEPTQSRSEYTPTSITQRWSTRVYDEASDIVDPTRSTPTANSEGSSTGFGLGTNVTSAEIEAYRRAIVEAATPRSGRDGWTTNATPTRYPSTRYW